MAIIKYGLFGLVLLVIIGVSCSSAAEEEEEPIRVPASTLQSVNSTMEASRSSATPEPTFTPEQTAAPEPTFTLEPTATMEPTFTPEPTATPFPTPTRIPPTPVLTFSQWRSQARADIPYDDLHRYNEEYIGDLVYYVAEVSYITESKTDEYWNETTQKWEEVVPEHDFDISVSITFKPCKDAVWNEAAGDYDYPIVGGYEEGSYTDSVQLEYFGPRLLYGDVIEFVGRVEGLDDHHSGPLFRAVVTQLIVKTSERNRMSCYG